MVRVLGALDVLVDNRPIEITGVLAQRLLAVLAMSAPEPSSVDRLADVLWPKGAPRNAANALQAHVTKLRRLLPDGAIETRPGGYALVLPVDANEFARLAGNGDAKAALKLWRGRAFDNLDHPDLTAEGSRLEEVRLLTLERHLVELIADGDAAGQLAELETLTLRHPTRERLWVLLMTALARSGRQAEALQAYQRARSILVEELGIEPGPELRAVEAAVLAQRIEPVTAQAPRRSGNLPAAANRFVGRVHERQIVAELLGEHRVVTLVGPGGAGKTRLALAVAESWRSRHGAWLVELAGLTDGTTLATLISALLGSGGMRDPSRPDGSANPFDALIEVIGDRQILLVIDNCEHLIDDVAKLVDGLVRACPALTVLTTSREGLAIGGEHLWPVPPLGSTDAAELFVLRAAAAAVEIPVGVSATDSLVAEICARLDGLPLALELAAARLRTISLSDLRSRLDDRFRLLTGGSRAALPRQQTLRAVVDWSYELLDPAERQVFCRLSVFNGSFTLEAASAVAATSNDDAFETAEILGRLVDKSLVIRIAESNEVRFRLLQTLAFYGRERLAESNDAAVEARTRHAKWFVGVARQAGHELRRAEQPEWSARLSRELDDLRAALDWSVSEAATDDGLNIALGMTWAFWLRGEIDEAHEWCESALATPGGAPALRALVMSWSGWFATHRRRPDVALDRLMSGLELARSDGTPEAYGLCALLAANVLAEFGRRSEAAELLAVAEASLTAADSAWGMAMLRLMVGVELTYSGELDGATAALSESISRFESIGDRWGQALGLATVASVWEVLGDYPEARGALERARDLFEAVVGGGFSLIATSRLGTLAALEGDLETADLLHRESVRQARDVAIGELLTQILLGRSFSHRYRGELAEAAEVLREVLAMDRVAAIPMAMAFAANSMGFVAEQNGDLEDAERWHLVGLNAARQTQDRRALALAVEGFAGVAVGRGDGERVGFLLGAADAARRSAGAPLPPGERRDVDRIESAARQASGDLLFEQAFPVGARAGIDGLISGLAATSA